jgi:DNA-binding NtrC family response regulator
MQCQTQHQFEDAAVDSLRTYFWSRNVRQLRHVVERLAAAAIDSEIITAAAVRRVLPASATYALLAGGATDLHVRFCEKDSLDDFLDRTMLSLYEQLRQQTGTHSQAARLLRVDRVALYQRIERARLRIQGSAML